MSNNDNGMGGTNGVRKAIVKKSGLWVAYRVMADNGMLLSSDGFYEGAIPLTMPMLMRIKKEITETTQQHLNTVKPVDQKGNLVVGVPKPKVRTVEVCSIVAAEFDEEVSIN